MASRGQKHPNVDSTAKESSAKKRKTENCQPSTSKNAEKQGKYIIILLVLISTIILHIALSRIILVLLCKKVVI